MIYSPNRENCFRIHSRGSSTRSRSLSRYLPTNSVSQTRKNNQSAFPPRPNPSVSPIHFELMSYLVGMAGISWGVVLVGWWISTGNQGKKEDRHRRKLLSVLLAEACLASRVPAACCSRGEVERTESLFQEAVARFAFPSRRQQHQNRK
ncbi:hypothetical protein LZ554_001613 [Drepanopeziza brunnea f. sp. 'monogermtubi']|nr:hypothetical protein LZ554_001613 [Drepanopeziza brunnea f. sp. 'monogermtubi']